MITVVFTPTKRYGGLAEQYHSLFRQNMYDFVWVIADDLYDERADVVAENCKDIEVLHYKPVEKPPGYWSNLAAIYNEGFDHAQRIGADVFISLQDYIILPGGVLGMMVCDVEETGSLVTGLVSYSDVPSLGDVVDPEGLWTIFGEPYTGFPSTYSWQDVRGTSGVYKPDTLQHTGVRPNSVGSIVDWELNWAGIPGEFIRDGIRVDPKYGEGIGYENQDFAWKVYLDYDKTPFINTANHVVSLPHTIYDPIERADYGVYSEMNRARHHAKYRQEEVA